MTDQQDRFDWRAALQRLESAERALLEEFQAGSDHVALLWAERAQRANQVLTRRDERIKALTLWVSGHQMTLMVTEELKVYPVRRLTAIPCTPPFIRGVVELKGRIISVVDLALLLRLVDQPSVAQPPYVVVITQGNQTLAIAAERVEGSSAVPDTGTHGEPIGEKDSLPSFVAAFSADHGYVIDSVQLFQYSLLVVKDEI